MLIARSKSKADTLVSHLAAPARTREIMLQLHNWLQTRRRQTVAVIVAVAGILLVTTGMSSV